MGGILEDKVILVTGASRGIGAALAYGLAKNGSTVVVNYNKSRKKAESVLNRIKSIDSKGIMVQFDVSREDEVKEGFRKIISDFKRIDVLINNAGILKTSPILEIQDNEAKEIFETNTLGALHCIKEFVNWMKDQWGIKKIINVSSISQDSPFFNGAHYAFSKSAIKMLTKCSALELGEYGITVNSLIPGIIRSEIDERYKDEELMKRMENIIPLKRIGEPEDMIGSAVFLSSHFSDYITGIDILVDGGFCLFKNKNPE